MSGLKMNATKSMIGHCLGAAGGMEAIATIQAMRTGWVHPTINNVRIWGLPLGTGASKEPWVAVATTQAMSTGRQILLRPFTTAPHYLPP